MQSKIDSQGVQTKGRGSEGDSREEGRANKMDPERARQESTDPVGMTARLTRALQNRDVQEQQEACGLLKEFTLVEGNRDAVVAAGAVPALVQVLQGADPGSGAAGQAAEALWSIAGGSAARRDSRADAMLAAGAVPVLLCAVGEGTVAGSGARNNAAKALYVLALSSKARSAMRDTHGAVAKLQAAKAKFSGDAGLVKEITDVLNYL